MISKKRREIKKKKFKDVSEINQLCIGVFIAKHEKEKAICTKLEELGGRVLSSVRAQGGKDLSSFLNVLSSIQSEYVCVFSALREEDAKNIIEAISVEFNFDHEGEGKAFVVNVDGYMGAKGPFLK